MVPKTERTSAQDPLGMEWGESEMPTRRAQALPQPGWCKAVGYTCVHRHTCECVSPAPSASTALALRPHLLLVSLLTPWLGSTPCLSLRIRRGGNANACGLWLCVNLADRACLAQLLPPKPGAASGRSRVRSGHKQVSWRSHEGLFDMRHHCGPS